MKETDSIDVGARPTNTTEEIFIKRTGNESAPPLPPDVNYEDYYSLVDTDLFEKYYRTRSLSDAAYWSLVISYSVLIIAGSIGNLLVILAVVNNKSKCLYLTCVLLN